MTIMGIVNARNERRINPTSIIIVIINCKPKCIIINIIT